MNTYRLSMVVLVVFLMITSMALVFVKHKSRTLFTELETLKSRQHKLDENWGRLMLEQSVLLSHDMVEKVARQKLRMQSPEDTQVIEIK